MKRTIYITFLVSLILGGCNSFLEVDPMGTETQATFYETPENAIYAVNACYDNIGVTEGPGPNGGWFQHNYIGFIGDMCTADCEKGSTESDYNSLYDFFEWRAKPNDGVLFAYWGNAYDGIARCNEVIYRLGSSTLDEALRNRLEGEALFIRAFWYLKLTMVFGGTPVFTEPVKPSEFGTTQRASYHEMYVRVTEDLKSAIDKLPKKSEYSSSDLGRITKGAARALLAKAYMYQIGMDAESTTTWDDVYTQTNAIVQSDEYALVSNFATIFEFEGENSSESVWELQMTEGSNANPPYKTGSNVNQFCGNRKDWGWGFFNPSQVLVDAFGEGDPRLSCTVYGPTFNDGIVQGQKPEYDLAQQCSPYLSRKVALAPGERPTLSTSSGYNWRMIRYAEVLLMHAEALYHKGDEGGARTYLEMIRSRARNSTFARGYIEGELSYTPTGFSANVPAVTASGSGLLDAIINERRLELAIEGMRFWDLVRTGKYLDDLDLKKETSQTNDGIYRYTNVDIKANCLSHCIDGPDGHKIPLMPIPIDEVQSWGLEQNPNY